MAIFQTARFRVRPEAVDRAVGAIEEFLDHIRANEPATKLYLSLREPDDPTRFVHVIVFEDEAAQHAHANSHAVNRFTGVLYPETVGGVEFTDFAAVSTKLPAQESR